MAQKKSFKADIANPAMQFITPPKEENEEIKETIKEPKKPQAVLSVETPVSTSSETPVPTEKTPVLNIPDGYKIVRIEKRSKRLQMLIRPSLYNKIKIKADSEGCSANDIMHRALEEIFENLSRPTKTPVPTEKAFASVPDGYKIVHDEKRSKRLPVLICPSLYKKIKDKANKEGCSVNDVMHRALEEVFEDLPYIRE